MNFELFIARRIHFSGSTNDRKKRVTPPAVRIAVAGIAIGMAVMILSVAIVIGFKQEVRAKVIGFGSHIQITNLDSNSSYETTPIHISDSLQNTLRHIPGVRHVESFATKPGLLKTDTDFQGIVLKGIDADYDWTFFRKHLKEGTPFTVTPGRMTTDVLISRHLSDLLRLRCGDTFLAYFVQDDVKARKFRISGIYDTGFSDYDRLFVLTDIAQIRHLNDWSPDAVSGLEILVDDYDHLDETADRVDDLLLNRRDSTGNTYYVRSIRELNPIIFNWLDLLDLNVVVILALMMAVSGFTMISGLLIIILERTNMIGILKAIGQPNGSLRRVFLYVSTFLIGRGMLWGNLIGLALCWVQWQFHVLTLDPSIYYLDAVPIRLGFSSWLLINIGALTVTLLMMLAPSYLITKISPARTIRFE